MRFKGYYINLKTRSHMYKAFETSNTDYIEFEDIKQNIMTHNICKEFACAASHTATLTRCLYQRDLPIISNDSNKCDIFMFYRLFKRPASYDPFYFICEDDFYIIDAEYYKDFLRDFDKIKKSKDWDIILMTHFGNNNYINNDNFMNKNNFLQNKKNTSTSAYIIKKSFLPYVIAAFDKAIKDFEYNNNNNINIFSFKHYWHDLQENHNFYIYNREFAGVRRDMVRG